VAASHRSTSAPSSTTTPSIRHNDVPASPTPLLVINCGVDDEDDHDQNDSFPYVYCCSTNSTLLL
jgi:hypothetical protein